MKTGEVIPIFWACDNDFVKYTVVSLQSVIANASKEFRYKTHILHTDIEPEMQDRIKTMCEEHFEICFVDVKTYLDTVSDRLPIRDYYSKTTYYRMFIAEMFPEYDKALYIDSDTIVLGDLAELYHKDLKDCYVGAAHEQVMVQTPVYGEYAEKVLGIDRNHYFNAGLLLINCKAFRENHILEQFVALLEEYTFVVTQDEDYLNLLCKDKVLWLEQQWNMEVFGEIPYAEDTFKVLHYIMVSKPWHYEDCRFGKYFWQYAKETFVYEEIRKVLKSYTDEERTKDSLCCERLMQTAVYEIHKENNYLKLKRNGTNKSKDRLMIMDKIAKLER